MSSGYVEETAVKELTSPPEYQKHINTCTMCEACWYNGCTTSDCSECGGFALQRSCPVCSGICGRIWNRNVSMSHRMRAAHWDGTCGLPTDTQMAYFLRDIQPTDDDLSVAMSDLNTS